MESTPYIAIDEAGVGLTAASEVNVVFTTGMDPAKVEVAAEVMNKNRVTADVLVGREELIEGATDFCCNNVRCSHAFGCCRFKVTK